MSKRDHGQTTSSLLANQAHRHARVLAAKDDLIFAQAGEIWRLHRILKEYGYAEQDDTPQERSGRQDRIRKSLAGRPSGPHDTRREGDAI